MALSKWASISIKIALRIPGCTIIDNLQNDIQFETIPTANTENGDFTHSDCLSIYIAVLLAAVHVFDCHVIGVT